MQTISMQQLSLRRILLRVVLSWLFAPTILAQKSAPSSRDLDLLIQSARNTEQQQDYVAAATAYEKLAALRPNDPLAHQSLGLAWYLQGTYAKAVSPLERAVMLDPRLWGARLYLGICYYRTNQFQRAVACLKLAGQARPKEAMALY